MKLINLEINAVKQFGELWNQINQEIGDWLKTNKSGDAEIH